MRLQLIVFFCLGAMLSPAASISPSGALFEPFTLRPSAQDWATHSLTLQPIHNAAQLDAVVQQISATDIVLAPLPGSASVSSDYAIWWHGSGGPNHHLHTAPKFNSCTLLLATLRNETGSSLSTLTVSYLMGASEVSEEVPGWRAYYSLTGTPGTWRLLPEFSVVTNGRVQKTLSLGNWDHGSALYFLWADANSDGPDGVYSLDDFEVIGGNQVGIGNITSGRRFDYRTPIHVRPVWNLAGTATNIALFNSGALVDESDTPTFDLTYQWPALGSHDLTLVARDDVGNVATSSVVRIEVVPSQAVISVLPSGSALEQFALPPALSNGWSSFSIPGSATNITDVAGLDAAVQALSVQDIILPPSTSSTIPPDSTALARWNSYLLLLYTRPSGNRANVLQAILRNDTGAAIPAIAVTYSTRNEVTADTVTVEDVPGHRAYFSHTGRPNDWVPIPNLSLSITGVVSTIVEVGSWPAGSELYLLWADDNGPSISEGAYTIDNFAVTPVPTLHARRVNASQAELLWSDRSNRFALHYKPSLYSGTWLVIPAPTSAEGVHHVLVDSTDSAFFRLFPRTDPANW